MDPGGLSPPPGFLLREMVCELGLSATLFSYSVRTVSVFYDILFLFYLSGGYESLSLNTVLSFNKTEESWQPAGQMTVPRAGHAAELSEDVSQNCP